MESIISFCFVMFEEVRLVIGTEFSLLWRSVMTTLIFFFCKWYRGLFWYVVRFWGCKQKVKKNSKNLES